MIEIQGNGLCSEVIQKRPLHGAETLLYFASAENAFDAAAAYLDSPAQTVTDLSLSLMLKAMHFHSRKRGAGTIHTKKRWNLIYRIMEHPAAKKLTYAMYARLSLKTDGLLDIEAQSFEAVRRKRFPPYMLHLRHSRLVDYVDLLTVTVAHYCLSEDHEMTQKLLIRSAKIQTPIDIGGSYAKFKREAFISERVIKKMQSWSLSTGILETPSEERVRLTSLIFSYAENLRGNSFLGNDWDDMVRRNINMDFMRKLYGMEGVADSYVEPLVKELLSEKNSMLDALK